MECAAEVRRAYLALKPEAVAVELPQTLSSYFLHGVSRLPDLSVVRMSQEKKDPLTIMIEPCDGCMEGLRSALDDKKAAYCIDLDVSDYPEYQEPFPDPYSFHKIGLQGYYEAYLAAGGTTEKGQLDQMREEQMARRLKELSLTHDSILFVCGMAHLERIRKLLHKSSFATHLPAERERVELCTLTEKAAREVMAEYGWLTSYYEAQREQLEAIPDRQRALFELYKKAIKPYEARAAVHFPVHQLSNLMKFGRNYALIGERLTPSLFQLLTAAKGCVSHAYAYEVWELATNTPFLKNIDGLEALDLTIEQVWGHSKIIRFHLAPPSRKPFGFLPRRKDRPNFQFEPTSPFGICSYPPEDVKVEKFGDFLHKKALNLLSEQGARTIPFSTSLEDGIDMKETLRHFATRALYVKTKGKPPGGVSSVVMIFDEDSRPDDPSFQPQYPWQVTWIGEHSQESDMAFYATPLKQELIGPGISRCRYGGFMLSSPPRRLFDIWSDPAYKELTSKAEMLLAAAIDYAVKPVIVYVAAKPPKEKIKHLAQWYGKKIAYIPIGQLSAIELERLRTFHVLDGHSRRQGAEEYIV